MNYIEEELEKNNICLILGDCIHKMKDIQDNYVDLILTDLPYGVSQNKWDSIIPLDVMWKEFNRICKKDGIIALTAIQPFSSKLVLSNIDNFKYEVIWEKTVGSGQLNIKRQPLRVHESILIFYSSFKTYNEQKTIGAPYSIKRKVTFGNRGYGAQKDSEKINDGFRHAKSIVKFSNPRIKGGHPTQKPVELMEYLIKTYSNENDVILDCCMGSCSAGIAAKRLNRKFVGIELEEKYYKMSMENIVKE